PTTTRGPHPRNPPAPSSATSNKGGSHRPGLTFPIRSRLSFSDFCLISRCSTAATCCSAQPPQIPNASQRGFTRPGEGTSTSSRSASSWRRRILRLSIRTSSPGRAPGTNIFLPAMAAMPLPSCVRGSIFAFSGSRLRVIQPCGGKFVEVGQVQSQERGTYKVQFTPQVGGVQLAAHELKAEVYKIRV